MYPAIYQIKSHTSTIPHAYSKIDRLWSPIKIVSTLIFNPINGFDEVVMPIKSLKTSNKPNFKELKSILLAHQ